MKEETSELKGKADPAGGKWLSKNNVDIINHFEKIGITYFLTKLWNMWKLDPHNAYTDDQKKAHFNLDLPRYDISMAEIIGVVEKQFDKTLHAFKNISSAPECYT